MIIHIVLYSLILVLYFFMRISRDFLIASAFNPSYTSVAKTLSILFTLLSVGFHALANLWTPQYTLIFANILFSILLIIVDIISLYTNIRWDVFLYYAFCDLVIASFIPLFWKIFFEKHSKNTEQYRRIFYFSQFGLAVGVLLALLYINLPIPKSLYFIIISTLLIYFTAQIPNSDRLLENTDAPINNPIKVKNFNYYLIPIYTVCSGILGGFINNTFKMICYVFLNKNALSFIYLIIVLWIVQSILNYTALLFIKKQQKLSISMILIVLLGYVVWCKNIWSMGALFIGFKLIKCLTSSRKEYIIGQNPQRDRLLSNDAIMSRVGKFISGAILSYFVLTNKIGANVYLFICVSFVIYLILSIIIEYNHNN